MKRILSYITVIFPFMLLLSSCGEKERVIPKEKMAEIYAGMYVIDQWLDDNRSLRHEADTSLVYAPILDRYGYTYDDYLNSVSVYMEDPMRYSRILRRTSEILNGRLSELKAEKKAREDAVRESRRLDSLRNLVRLDIDSLMSIMVRVNPSDSLVVGPDSLGFLDFRFVQSGDTTYAGPALVIKSDSLALASDSLKVASDALDALESAAGKNSRIDHFYPAGKKLDTKRSLRDIILEPAETKKRVPEGQPDESGAVGRKVLLPRDTLINVK